ncbi:MAG: NAD-dependent DNA ligase LigA [Lachnospiraceae bacterium]|nr:NAD-dependent DNA ligase LigA [Lachnospiraceae bacterium]
MKEKMERLKELTTLLNEASKAYYMNATEIMSNLEYDRLYDELVALEKELNITLAASPTVNVGYEVVSELPKETHPEPMLSLDKTKDREALRDWLGAQSGNLSWKLDGLTVVLTYREGKLEKAVTRGNGEVGEVITANAKTFINLPLSIPYKQELVLRGEAVISYSDFEKINHEIEEEALKYKNPRNLCSGSVRQLNSEITSKRRVRFYAFSLVGAQEVDFHNSRACQMEWLKEQGFEVVESKPVNADNIISAVEWFENEIKTYDIPSDGLVLNYDDIAYGRSLGRTAKFPRDTYAFKWSDETAETTLTEVEWSASRTGLINPVAVFDAVWLEGTSVTRASLHNLSIMEEMQLGIGDRILVYKANMIIPQIAKNLTRTGGCSAPAVCPVCSRETRIKNDNGIKYVYCENPDCMAKKVKSLSLMVSRDAFNIEGLSESTLEKFVSMGMIHEKADIFHLANYKQAIIEREGFGAKSYDNLIAAIEKSREITLAKFIYALGISNIGLSTAKLICSHFQNDWEKIKDATVEELTGISGIGDVIARAFVAYMHQPDNLEMVEKLFKEVTIQKEETNAEQKLAGITFVITGSVEHFDNRNQVKEVVEQNGGKVTGSVTSNTNYLINNDINSNSSKNKKAKQLGIPIITEEDFLAMLE